MNKKQLKILEEFRKNLPKDEWILSVPNKYVNLEKSFHPKKRRIQT
jgi:hypothetical protein